MCVESSEVMTDGEDVSAVQMGEREGMIQVQLAEILFCESLEHVSV